MWIYLSHELGSGKSNTCNKEEEKFHRQLFLSSSYHIQTSIYLSTPTDRHCLGGPAMEFSEEVVPIVRILVVSNSSAPDSKDSSG